MNAKQIRPLMALTIFCLSCGSARQEEQNKEALSDAVRLNSPMADSASLPNIQELKSQLSEKPNDSLVFKIHAEYKYKSQDVLKSTLAIEKKCRQLGGYIHKSELHSEELGREIIQVSADSVQENFKYHLTNEMTIRIPAEHLDSLLNSTLPDMIFLDYRIIHADEVSDEIQNKNERIALEEAIQSTLPNPDKDQHLASKHQSQFIYDKIESKRHQQSQKEALRAMHQEIRYAYVQFSIYQNPVVQHIRKSKPSQVDQYENQFSVKLQEAWIWNIELFKNIMLFLLKSIWFILLCLLGYYIYRKKIST